MIQLIYKTHYARNNIVYNEESDVKISYYMIKLLKTRIVMNVVS